MKGGGGDFRACLVFHVLRLVSLWRNTPTFGTGRASRGPEDPVLSPLRELGFLVGFPTVETVGYYRSSRWDLKGGFGFQIPKVCESSSGFEGVFLA